MSKGKGMGKGGGMTSPSKGSSHGTTKGGKVSSPGSVGGGKRKRVHMYTHTSLVLPLALGLGLALVGCQQLGPIATGTNPIAGTVQLTLKDERALFTAEAAYNGLTTAAISAAKAGVLKGDAAAKVNDVRRKAWSALLVARKFHAAANAPELTSAITQVYNAVGEGWALIGKK